MRKSSHYKWWAVASIATGTLVTVADIGEVNVAMPTIADQFGSNLSTVQWLATGHLLATSALLMPMGRLSDMIGRKRIYLWGLLIFTLGSGVGRDSPQSYGANHGQNPAGHGYRIGPREPDGHNGLHLPRGRTGQGPGLSHDHGWNCVDYRTGHWRRFCGCFWLAVGVFPKHSSGYLVYLGAFPNPQREGINAIRPQSPLW